MRVVQVSFFVDPEQRPPERLLEDWFSLADIAEAAASAGLEVNVVQASMRTGCIERSGVTYHFIAPPAPAARLTRNRAFVALMTALRPDVLHVHGLGYPRAVLELAAFAPGVPILLQDHANRLPRLWRRGAWRRALAAAHGISFCARAQAEPFRRAGLLPSAARVFEIPESTSRFTPGSSIRARHATGVHGRPAVLWVGHLDANKDPLTVLDAIGITAATLPGIELWCCFGSAPMMSAVSARIDTDPALRDRVHLLGRVPHARVEELMRAADLFVHASHREGSSFALIEALATGLTPVVSDIPSLRALTSDGSVGVLWQAGNAHALASALERAAEMLEPDTRRAVRAYFDARLSVGAVGQRLAAAYETLAGEAVT